MMDRPEVNEPARPGPAPRKGFLVIVSMLAAQAAWSPSAHAAKGEAASVDGRISAAIAAYRAKAPKAVVGVSVVDVHEERTIFSLRPGQPFLPASNQKVLTSAFALARLGGDFRFVTRAHIVGRDLWVVGSGDPTLGDPLLAGRASKSIYAEMDRWAAAIRKRAGNVIEGDLIAVAGFDGTKEPLSAYRHADWPKSHYRWWYAAPAAAVNFNNNCFDVTFTVKAGKATPIVMPQSRLIRVVNLVKVAKRHVWSLHANEDDSEVTLRGTVKRSAPDPISVPANDPPLLFARVLADRLQRAGVAVRGKVRTAKTPPDSLADPAAAVCSTSTPIADVMRRANKRSLNMAAECLLLRAGTGDWAGSAKVMTDTLVKAYGLSAGDLVVRDGSGLSRRNRVTPAAMTKVLTALMRRKDVAVFGGSLAIAGVDGTLTRRMTSAYCRGRVVGKTGYIAGVCCLSGYILDKTRRPALAYAIFVNRAPGAWGARQLQDKICKLLVESVGK